MSEKTLSIFIDESGDFGNYHYHSPLYLFTMILHEQNISITENIHSLESHLKNLGYPQHAIHTGPLIRRESIYLHDKIEERKRLFHALFHFCRKLDFHYLCVVTKKREYPNAAALTTKLSKTLSNLLQTHHCYFMQFERIVVYYDNGQIELTKILTSTFPTYYPQTEFRKNYLKPLSKKQLSKTDNPH